MHQFMKNFATCIVGFMSVSGLISGCAGAGEQDSSDLDPAAFNESEFGQAEEALNSNTNCGTASADKSYTSIISPVFTSPNTYSAGRNGCEKAYFVRVDGYRTNNTNKYNYFQFAGATPTTQAACQDARLLVYVFERKADGTATHIGNQSLAGTWSAPGGGVVGDCSLPVVTVDNPCTDTVRGAFSLTTGKNYEFAVSARTNNAGNPVMQKIRMSSNTRSTCVPR